MNIVFFGSSKLVIPIIKVLNTNFDLQLVITTEQHTTDAVPSYCNEKDIPYASVTTLSDKKIITTLKTINAPVAVLADFGLILPDETLQLFPKGIINVHPSLLPKFRGPTPVQSAMISGVKETGVTIIRLDDQVDHGPVLAQETEPILATDTGETLHIRLFQKGASLLAKTLPDYLSGVLIPTTQEHEKATFTTRLTRQSGFVDAAKLPSPAALERLIRAYYPWPGVWTILKLKEEEKRVKLLPDKKLQVQDKKPMNYKDFLNGYPEMKDWIEKISN